MGLKIHEHPPSAALSLPPLAPGQCWDRHLLATALLTAVTVCLMQKAQLHNLGVHVCLVNCKATAGGYSKGVLFLQCGTYSIRSALQNETSSGLLITLKTHLEVLQPVGHLHEVDLVAHLQQQRRRLVRNAGMLDLATARRAQT